jgi:hypothetical protein
MKNIQYTLSLRKIITSALASLCLVFLCSCETLKPYDYSNFKKFKPKSILVIPPLNHSTELKGTYSCLSSASSPIAEMGYYVFPVTVIDEMLKQNGMPGPGEMHQASLKKIVEIINPDAVMYINIEEYGTKFRLLESRSDVTLNAKLVHTKTGTLLWNGKTHTVDSNGSSSGGLASIMVNAVVSQVVNDASDRSNLVCRQANLTLFSQKDHGLLYGPYHPKYNQQ